MDRSASPTTRTASPSEETLGFRMLTGERRRYETHLTRLEAGDDWARGRTLTLEQAAEILGSPS